MPILKKILVLFLAISHATTVFANIANIGTDHEHTTNSHKLSLADAEMTDHHAPAEHLDQSETDRRHSEDTDGTHNSAGLHKCCDCVGCDHCGSCGGCTGFLALLPVFYTTTFFKNHAMVSMRTPPTSFRPPPIEQFPD